MAQIKIPLSKSKIFLGIGGSVLFIVLGIFLITVVANQQTRFNPLLIKGIGISSVLFFGMTTLYGIRKLFDKAIGLIIDENGITDNSSGVSAGLIKWNEITSIRTAQIMSTKFLLIDTFNPEKYVGRGNKFKEKLMRTNMKMYGTPISISSNTLKMNFDKLEHLVQTAFNKYKP
jgi:hypothetical protein